MKRDALIATWDLPDPDPDIDIDNPELSVHFSSYPAFSTVFDQTGWDKDDTSIIGELQGAELKLLAGIFCYQVQLLTAQRVKELDTWSYGLLDHLAYMSRNGFWKLEPELTVTEVRFGTTDSGRLTSFWNSLTVPQVESLVTALLKFLRWLPDREYQGDIAGVEAILLRVAILFKSCTG